MRTFEWILTATVAGAIFLPVALGFRLKRGRAAAALLLAVALQAVVEGFRWQLWPLALAAAGLAAGDVVREDRRVRGLPRIRRAVLGTVGLGGLVALPLLLPVPALPPPTGPFAVGTATFLLVDPAREERYGREPAGEETAGEEAAPGPPRRIVVQVWYPADPVEDAEPVPWNADIDVVGPAMARRLGFPGFFLSHTAGVRAHAVEEAPPLSGRFPVVLSAHGWTGFRTINLNQLESLASHGYFVVAPDHAYGAIATRFPDGEVVALDEAALPAEEDVGAEAYAEASEALVETFAGDLILILDNLAAGEPGPFGPLAGHADLERVGLVGHSTGGGAAVRVCLSDPRCDAVVGFDPWVEPIPNRLVANELAMPSLFVRSDGWRGTPNDARLRGLAERSPSISYWMGLTGAGHNDFVMTPLFSPIADRLGLKGPIPSHRVLAILDDYLVGFFDRFLLEVGGAALDQPPPPEVDFEVIP